MMKITTRATLCLVLSLLALNSNWAVAQADKSETAQEVTDFKPPPRTIKDVITAVENGKADESEVLRAKQIIALPRLETTDKGELRKHHLARAEAFQRLGNISQAIEEMQVVTSQYLGSAPLLMVNDWQTLARFEQRGGNMLRAIDAIEKARSSITPNILGLNMLISRLSVAFYSQIGNFEAAEKIPVAKVKYYLREAMAINKVKSKNFMSILKK